MTLRGPVFPPLLSAQSLAADKSAFAQAARLAHRGKKGAGDVIWSLSRARAELAIIVEPEVELARAQQMAPLSMLAMGDALGVICPPQVSVLFRWPGDILINGAKAGQVKLAVARPPPSGQDAAHPDAARPEAAAQEIPRWLVIGMSLQLMHEDHGREPGEDLERTCLLEEGVGADVSRSDIIQMIASYWMAGLSGWSDTGAAAYHERWLFRAHGREEDIVVKDQAGTRHIGKVLGLDETAGLILAPSLDIAGASAGPVCLPFAPHLVHLDEIG